MKTQVHVYLSFTIKSLLIGMGMALSLICIFLLSTDYSSLIIFLVDTFSFSEDKIVSLKTEFLTPARIQVIKGILLLCLGIYLISLIYLVRKVKSVINQIIQTSYLICCIIGSVWKELQTLSIIQKILLFLSFLVVLCLFIHGLIVYPLRNDEVFSYLYLVDKGFIVTSVYYPGPNNHIFYLQACTFIDLLTNNTKLIMRLPAVVAGLLSYTILFCYFFKRQSFQAGLFISIFFTLSFNCYFYFLHGRGYAFEYLFFITSFICILELNKQSIYQSIFRITYILSSIAGLYTSPAYLYPLASLHLAYFIILLYSKKQSGLKEFISVSAAIGLVTFLLYVPVFAVSGFASVLSNSWVKPMSIVEFGNGYLDYLNQLFNHLFNSSTLGLLLFFLLLVSGIVIIWKMRHKAMCVLILSCSIVPFLMLPIQRVFPFFRVFDYLLLVILILLFFIINFLLTVIPNFKSNKLLWLVPFVILGLWTGTTIYKFEKTGLRFYSQLNSFINQLFELPFKTVCVQEETYDLFIRYESQQRAKKIDILSDKSSLPDVVIVDQRSEEKVDQNLKLYVFYKENEFVKAYLSKEFLTRISKRP